jgi:Tol biopolymer transport system component
MGLPFERIEEVFNAAAKLPAAERGAFLSRACAGDPDLRREVETRLARHNPGDPFMTAEAAKAALTRTLPAGEMVGPYRIVGILGEGGMGVVYQAEDTRLGRAVALKFVKTGFDARFESEAKAISALNHPHVATLYDISQHHGTSCLVLEYVEGKPLKGPLSLPLTLGYAVQIAAALEAAHAAGIVHRDLKPSNILVNQQGLIKVLDFGLAKLTKSAPAQDGPTQTLEHETKQGTIAGTAAYMSPEQAEGKTVDSRSDIFSFGAVLYETISGQRAFRGNSTLSVIAAVLEREPEPLPGIPEELKRVLDRTLRKHAAERWQHIGDVRLALEDVKTALGQPSRERPKPAPGWRLTALAALGAVALAVAGYLVLRNAGLSPDGPSYHFEQITDEPGQEMNPSLSPDGRSVVYASHSSGNWDIYLLRVGGKNPINLTKGAAADNTQPVFSPDGERIAFRSERAGGGIFVMGSTGESVRRLTDFCYFPAWSPDGREIACSTVNTRRPDVRDSLSSQIFAIDAGSGKRRLVSGGIADAVQPSWSPDGRHIAFWGVREGARDIFTVSREGSDVVSVTNDEPLDWNPVWSPDGKFLYFSSDRGGAMNLWRVAMAASGKPAGDPEPVNVPSAYAASVSFSRDGRRLAYSSCQRSSNIYRVEFDPVRESIIGAPRAVTQGVKETLYPAFSRDGAWIAFTLLGLHEDLAVVRPDGSDLRRITDDPAHDRSPRWSPGGDRIAFMSTRSGRYEIWTIHPDGSVLQQLTEESPRGGVMYPAWSPDGRRLTYSLPDEMSYTLDIGKPWREQQPQLARAKLPGRSWLWLNDWSHDGSKIAGTVQNPDGGTLGIGAYSPGSKKFEQYTDFGQLPRWLPDGRRLLFHARDRIFLVDSTDQRTKEVLSTKEGTINPYFDLSWDGRMIAYSLESMDSDVWIMTREK